LGRGVMNLRKLFSEAAKEVEKEDEMCGLAGEMYEDWAWDVHVRFMKKIYPSPIFCDIKLSKEKLKKSKDEMN